MKGADLNISTILAQARLALAQGKQEEFEEIKDRIEQAIQARPTIELRQAHQILTQLSGAPAETGLASTAGALQPSWAALAEQLKVDPALIETLRGMGFSVDFSRLAGADEQLFESVAFNALVSAFEAAVEQDGLDAAKNKTVRARLDALVEELGLAPEARGAVLAVAVAKVNELDAAETEEAARRLATQNQYLDELDQYLEFLADTKKNLASQGAKAQTTVEFLSIEIKDGAVQQSKTGSRLVNIEQLQAEIRRVEDQVAAGKEVKQDLRDVASRLGQWERKTSLESALTRILPPEGTVVSNDIVVGDGADYPQHVSDNDQTGYMCMQAIARHFGRAIHYQSDQTYSGMLTMAANSGMKTSEINDANTETLQACLDRGLPVMIKGSSYGEPKWLLVTGYQTNDQGEISRWITRDFTKQESQEVSTSQLNQFWSNEPWDSATGQEHFMLAMAPEGTPEAALLPPSQRGMSAEALALRTDIEHAADNLRDVVWPFKGLLTKRFEGVRPWLEECIQHSAFDVTGGKLVLGNLPYEIRSDLPEAFLDRLSQELRQAGYDLAAIKESALAGRRDLDDPAIMRQDKDDNITYGRIGGSLFVDGISANDIDQGSIGDCYFMAALSAVADSDPSIIQNALKDNGDGTYTVRFYDAQGKEVFITVDDELPIWPGGKPVYGSSTNAVELWPAIFEKAYAKWRGGYDNIGNGGYKEYALQQLTGRRTRSTSSWRLVVELAKKNVPMAASTYGNKKKGKKKYENTGISSWHTYTVIDAYEEDGQRWIVLRNPWGRGEYTGEPFDGTDDGVFRMKWGDFDKYFKDSIAFTTQTPIANTNTPWSNSPWSGVVNA